MEILRAYYFHTLFSICRAIAMIFILAALIVIIVAVAVPIWVKIPSRQTSVGSIYLFQLTMFENCTILLSRAEHSIMSDLRDFASDVGEVVEHGSLKALSHSASAQMEEDINKQKQLPTLAEKTGVGPGMIRVNSQRLTTVVPLMNSNYTMNDDELYALIDSGDNSQFRNHSYAGVCENYSFGGKCN